MKKFVYIFQKKVSITKDRNVTSRLNDYFVRGKKAAFLVFQTIKIILIPSEIEFKRFVPLRLSTDGLGSLPFFLSRDTSREFRKKILFF